MRILFVVEVKNLQEGSFLPKVGFGEMEMLIGWMKSYLAEKMEYYSHEWRIVKYVPQDPSDNGTKPVIH